jgi:hypothetical protein
VAAGVTKSFPLGDQGEKGVIIYFFSETKATAY